MPYAVHALAIDAGLVGANHAGEERLRVEVLADVLRPLVNVEVEAHAVAGAVAEVAAGFP